MIYALRSMRRVAITAFGAVTPIGLDALSTWESAVAGRSGIGFIESFDASEFPVRIAGEVRGFDPSALIPAKEARRMDRNVLLAVAAAQEAWDEAGIEEFDPARVGILVGSAIGGIATIAEQQQIFLERGGRPRLAVLHPVGARRHGERPDRDPARGHRPELRARLGLRDRLDGDRRGRRDDRARPGRHRPRGRHRGRDHPAHPRRLLRDAGPRGRGRRPDARDAPVRRDPGRLRDGRGRLHPRARGARVGEGPRRHDLRGGGRLRRLERRAPPRPARARGNRGRGDDHARR